MYITGFCLLPRYCEIFISRCGESFISSPSNSQRPSITFEGYQIVGLYTPTIIPEFTANTRSACLARSPFNLQYFLVHSYRFGRFPDKYVLLTFRQRILSSTLFHTMQIYRILQIYSIMNLSCLLFILLKRIIN